MLYEEYQWSLEKGSKELGFNDKMDYGFLEEKADKQFHIGNKYMCIYDYYEFSDINDKGLLYEKGKIYELTHKVKNNTYLELAFDNNKSWIKGGCIFAYFDNKPL